MNKAQKFAHKLLEILREKPISKNSKWHVFIGIIAVVIMTIIILKIM